MVVTSKAPPDLVKHTCLTIWKVAEIYGKLEQTRILGKSARTRSNQDTTLVLAVGGTINASMRAEASKHVIWLEIAHHGLRGDDGGGGRDDKHGPVGPAYFRKSSWDYCRIIHIQNLIHAMLIRLRRSRAAGAQQPASTIRVDNCSTADRRAAASCDCAVCSCGRLTSREGTCSR